VRESQCLHGGMSSGGRRRYNSRKERGALSSLEQEEGKGHRVAHRNCGGGHG
jgi:hypothetical protein